MNDEPTILEAIKDGIYLLKRRNRGPAAIGFVTTEDGTTPFLMVQGSLFQRFDQDPAFEPDLEGWARFAGRYSPPLAWWQPIDVRVEQGRLVLASADWPERELICTLLTNRRFACKIGCFSFEVGPDGSGTRLSWESDFRFSRETQGT